MCVCVERLPSRVSVDRCERFKGFLGPIVELDEDAQSTSHLLALALDCQPEAGWLATKSCARATWPFRVTGCRLPDGGNLWKRSPASDATRKENYIANKTARSGHLCATLSKDGRSATGYACAITCPPRSTAFTPEPKTRPGKICASARPRF